MTAPEPDGIVWHTSSYSGTAGDFVEVGWHPSSDDHGATMDWVLVRDSKDRTVSVLAFFALPGKHSSLPSP